MWFSFAHSWFELYQEKINWQKIFLLRNIRFLKLGNFEIFISNFETFELRNFFLKSEILSLRILKIKAWNFDNEIWGLNFFENWRFELKIWEWKFWIENLDFERYLKTLKKIFFFFWVDRVNLVWLSWLSFGLSLSVRAEILAPYFFVSSFFPFLLHLHQLLFLH